MLALLAAVEGTVARWDLHFRFSWTDDWKTAGRAARREATGGEVLCFGDSLIKFGAVPSILGRRLGGTTYNLAVCGGQPPACYMLLRRALAAGARPKAVVIGFAPHMIAHGPRRNHRQWPELVTASEALDLAWTARDASLLGEILVRRALPTAKDHYEIGRNILEALRGESSRNVATNLTHRRNRQVNAGAQVVPFNPGFHGEVDPESRDYFPRMWRMEPTNEAFLRRFLALAASHRIAVYWVIPPVAPALLERRERLGLEPIFTCYVRDLQARHPGLAVIDGRRSGFGPGQFIDPVHLNREGAAAFSEALAQVLVRTPAEGAWVDLPPFRRPSELPFEDMEQSRLALEARGTALR
jgi:hypothetical protein